ncbi:MAG TPA: sigma-70 family RNA polymerase sigma factor [Terriglobales bacterium]|nr:sigma-70 family RNA polymerase sigma factor [Terriglobales bacterium]
MPEPSALVDDDLGLVRRACAGERDAFYALVSRYERPLYRTALAITRNPADAEDVVQETFLRAYEHLAQFRGEAKFQTWLTQIAINTARMKLRKGHGALWESLDQPRETDDGMMPRDVTEWRENPEEQFTRQEMENLLHQAMNGLPPGYREVLTLRDIQMLSTEETAEALGLTQANVKTRLLRARLQLRERLAGALSHKRGNGHHGL